MHDADERLARLSCRFRERFVDYATLTSIVRGWAREFPDLVRLDAIGESRQGRSLWRVRLGRHPERARPAVWVDANMHASELCGTNVALGIAEDVLRLHLAPDEELHGLPQHVAEALREVSFHVLPRMSPDGAEAVLETGRWVRSVPRDDRFGRTAPHWVSGDVDGDGLALLMRKEDAAGEYVALDEPSGLLVPREIEDPGPYYKLYPEGFIDGYDGFTVPTPHFLSDNFPDLNRNFPWSWQPEPGQEGAGSFPASEPESRAVVEAATRTPHLFVWLNLHTFGGVFIRPLGHEPDAKMPRADLSVFQQVAAWGERFTGYPTVSGYEEFTYQPEQPLHGDLSDYAYHQRGCLAYACELWDLFRRIGAARPKRFCDHYTHWSRQDWLNLARWDAEHNEGRLFRPWKRVEHPQLGSVEVGGFDPRFGLWNPPTHEIDGICRGQSAAFLRVAALVPRIVTSAGTRALGEDLCLVELCVENVGYLPTYGVEAAKGLAHSEPLSVQAETEGCRLETGADARQSIGHLEGWGRGRFGHSLQMPRSRGNGTRGVVRVMVRGRGTVTFRVGSCRVGFVEHRVNVGDRSTA